LDLINIAVQEIQIQGPKLTEPEFACRFWYN